MTVSDRLIALNLISANKSAKEKSKIASLFDELYFDILEFPIMPGSDFVNNMWQRWEHYTHKSNSLSGATFEVILATLLYRSGIAPLYVQAVISFVPNVNFDFVGYTKEYGPIILSAKTSLRERYKQADLEGMMVRQVHRKAKSFVITMHKAEAKTVNEKIENGQVLGLDEVVVASDERFNSFIQDLASLTFYKPEKIDVIKGNRIINNS